MDITSFLIVLIVGLIGGFFNTFVGAGSLLTIPTLIILGLPPQVAIASNRLGVIGSDIAGWYGFHKKNLIKYRIAAMLSIPALVGAIIGANLILEFNENNLRKIIGLVTVVILALIIFKPDLGVAKPKSRKKRSHYFIGAAISFVVGIYGGFYGAGAGTFLFYILILFFGQTFIESAGTHSLANLSFSVTAAIIFAYNGVINYVWVLPLFIGSFAGSFISAYYSDRIGNVWLKRLFVVVVSLLVIKLLI